MPPLANCLRGVKYRFVSGETGAGEQGSAHIHHRIPSGSPGGGRPAGRGV